MLQNTWTNKAWAVTPVGEEKKYWFHDANITLRSGKVNYLGERILGIYDWQKIIILLHLNSCLVSLIMILKEENLL